MDLVKALISSKKESFVYWLGCFTGLYVEYLGILLLGTLAMTIQGQKVLARNRSSLRFILLLQEVLRGFLFGNLYNRTHKC